MKISYECEELIEELLEDIAEFGENKAMYAFFEKIQGYTFLTNYDFIEEEAPLTSKEVGNAIIKVMTAKEILETLEEQNRII